MNIRSSNWIWTTPAGETVVARLIGQRATSRGHRVILMDTANRLYVGDLIDGRGTVALGPVDVHLAVAAAERAIDGERDHHSVTRLVNELSVALVGLACQVDQAAHVEGGAA